MSRYQLTGADGILPRVNSLQVKPPVSIAFREKLRIEQIRLIEEDCGALDVERPADMPGGLLCWLNARRQLLQKQQEVNAALAHGPHLYHWALAVLMLLMAVVGVSTTFSALADARDTLNIFWILGVLLGFNWLSLMLWLALSLLPNSSGGLVAPAFNRLMHWLLPSKGKAGKTPAANRAFLRTAFAPAWAKWQLGQITHLVWMSYVLGGFIALLLLFSTRQFDFIWESTLLGGDTFVRLTQTLSAPLNALNWPVPTHAQILASQSGTPALDPANTRRIWAIFLLGCLLLYGLLPRVFFWLLCYWQLRSRQKRFQLDLTLPYYLRLQQALWPQAGSGRVLDADTHPRASTAATSVTGAGRVPDKALWLGIELGHNEPWPPTASRNQVLGNIVDAETLQTALAQLKEQRHSALAIAVAVNKAADRGLLRMLRQLLELRAPEQVWLVLRASEPVPASKFQSWAKAVAQTGILPTHVVPWVDAP